MQITAAELQAYRQALEGIPGAIAVLNTIADCEGDLEDAAITIALQVGQEPDESDGWVQSVAKRWRHVICHPDLKPVVTASKLAALVTQLGERTTLPTPLAILVAIVVIKTGGDTFCAAFW